MVPTPAPSLSTGSTIVATSVPATTPTVNDDPWGIVSHPGPHNFLVYAIPAIGSVVIFALCTWYCCRPRNIPLRQFGTPFRSPEDEGCNIPEKPPVFYEVYVSEYSDTQLRLPLSLAISEAEKLNGSHSPELRRTILVKMPSPSLETQSRSNQSDWEELLPELAFGTEDIRCLQ